MRVVEVKSVDGLPGLRLVWRSLLKETSGASFHQSCEWLEATFPLQPSTSRLRILLVTGGGETVGILPLVQSDRATRYGTTRVLGFPQHPPASFHGPIGPQPTATLMGALRYLRDHQHSWDVLEFGNLDSAAAHYQRMRTALQMAEMPFSEFAEAPCPVVQLTNTEPADAAVSEDVVWNLVANSNFERYRPLGTMYNDADPCWDIFDQCLELACNDRQRNRASRNILRDIHAAACRAGAADLSLLRNGSQIAACCYNVHWDGTLVMVFGGQVKADAVLASSRQHWGDTSERVHDGKLPRRLISRMLRDSLARQDVRWLPDQEMLDSAGEATDLSLLERSRIVHDRRRGAHRFMGRLAQWLPLKS